MPSPKACSSARTGKSVYVTSEVGDLVHLVDADSGNVVQDVVVGTRPRRFAATPDGKELWVSTELSGEVYIIDRDKFTVDRQDRVPAARHAQDRRHAGRPAP